MYVKSWILLCSLSTGEDEIMCMFQPPEEYCEDLMEDDDSGFEGLSLENQSYQKSVRADQYSR